MITDEAEAASRQQMSFHGFIGKLCSSCLPIAHLIQTSGLGEVDCVHLNSARHIFHSPAPKAQRTQQKRRKTV